MILRVVPTATKNQFDVLLKIAAGNGSVGLRGVTASLPRPGWVTLTVPPVEDWTDSLDRLPSVQRDRVMSPEFYTTLQQAVTARIPLPPG